MVAVTASCMFLDVIVLLQTKSVGPLTGPYNGSMPVVLELHLGGLGKPYGLTEIVCHHSQPNFLSLIYSSSPILPYTVLICCLAQTSYAVLPLLPPTVVVSCEQVY